MNDGGGGKRSFHSSTVRLVTVLEPSADLNGRGAAPDLGQTRNSDTRFVKYQKLSNPTIEAFIIPSLLPDSASAQQAAAPFATHAALFATCYSKDQPS